MPTVQNRQKSDKTSIYASRGGKINLPICVTFSPYFTFTPPYFLHDYLIPLVQGHMAIHAALS